MKQLGLGDHGFAKGRKTTRRERFLNEMDAVVPWARLVALIAPHYPTEGRRGRPPMPLETMLRIHFMQLWFSYSDPAMEEALHDMPLLRRFAGLSVGEDAIPDETTILNFRHLLERHQLAVQMLDEVNSLLKAKGLLLQRGTTVDATLIAAPPSTKNRERKRDPEMSSTKKGNQWYFGMKCHIGADSASGLVHTVVGTAAKVADVRVVDDLLHGEETEVFGDKAYTTGERNLSASDPAKGPIWGFPYKRPKGGELPEWKQEINQHLASLRARVEHPFRVVKRQFGFTKVRYRGLMKNTAHLTTMFALANLYTARRPLLASTG
jgi:IS5 family transposase